MTTTQLLTLLTGPGGLLIALLAVLFLGAKKEPVWVFYSMYRMEQERRVQAEQRLDQANAAADVAREQLQEFKAMLDRTAALAASSIRTQDQPGTVKP